MSPDKVVDEGMAVRVPTLPSVPAAPVNPPSTLTPFLSEKEAVWASVNPVVLSL
ncbi:hypothetical protein [Spirosoma sp. KUDC1026]|uniref:hypothetical protein n=1 Tax=Spirosoma sp. KUDC1026 TaxID=2745947 RepID=UPI00159BBB3C|nr:hypothetical protein [Spirosoma sp. KUDC1026]QKZ12736.1 hypothetical protein HU175_08865 [Spirosoma sp. KUDC1026]